MVENEVSVCLERKLCQSVKKSVFVLFPRRKVLYIFYFVIVDTFNDPHLQ